MNRCMWIIEKIVILIRAQFVGGLGVLNTPKLFYINLDFLIITGIHNHKKHQEKKQRRFSTPVFSFKLCSFIHFYKIAPIILNLFRYYFIVLYTYIQF